MEHLHTCPLHLKLMPTALLSHILHNEETRNNTFDYIFHSQLKKLLLNFSDYFIWNCSQPGEICHLHLCVIIKQSTQCCKASLVESLWARNDGLIAWDAKQLLTCRISWLEDRMISCSAGGEIFRPSLNATDIRAACPTQKANNGGLEDGQSPLVIITFPLSLSLFF